MPKTILRDGPNPASMCTVYIKKFVDTVSGEIEAGYATGFLYRHKKQTWLVTNWHVLTGRRPDAPGELLYGYGDCPRRIRCVHPLKQIGAFSTPLELDLYHNGRPIWVEDPSGSGVDLAAIAISLPEDVSGLTIQDACVEDDRPLDIGTDVVITGYALGHGPRSPFPIWKRAMIASEPKYLVDGEPFVFLDSPGVPGMSGSPVYRLDRGFYSTKTDGKSALEKLNAIDFNSDHPILSFVGVYAGSSGSKDLEHLNLGRMFIGGILHAMLESPAAGKNPFPPSSVSEAL